MPIGVSEHTGGVDITDTAVNIAASQMDGGYIVQVRQGRILWAISAAAPTDDKDFWQAGQGQYICFKAGSGALGCWVKRAGSLPAVVSIARE